MSLCFFAIKDFIFIFMPYNIIHNMNIKYRVTYTYRRNKRNRKIITLALHAYV